MQSNIFSLIPADAETVTGVGRAELQEYINLKFPDVPLPVVAHYVYTCYVRNVNPLLNYIYITLFNTKQKDGTYKKEHCLVTGIDTFRLIAQRTGQYAGKKAPLYLKEGGEWEDFVLPDENVLGCRITVIKHLHGLLVETTCDAYMKEYRKNFGQWNTMPNHMIAKCAESLALRTAFPDELQGLYTEEEMGYTQDQDEPKTVDYQGKAKEFIDSVATVIPSKYWESLYNSQVNTEKDLKKIKQLVYEASSREMADAFQDEVKRQKFVDWFALNQHYTQQKLEMIMNRYVAISNPANLIVYDMEKVKAIIDTIESLESQSERMALVATIEEHYKTHPDVKQVMINYSLGNDNGN